MSVSSISSSTGINRADWRSTVKQGKQDFSQLLGSLQSGDVNGAQQAYAAMQQLLPGFQSSAQADAASGSSASSGNAAANTIGTDFSALGTALNSGSLAGAQDAVAKLQQDAQAYQQDHHKFGDLQHAKDVYQSMQQNSTSGTSSSNSAASGNSLDTDLTALGQALQSGSMSSAQDAFAKLQQDLQSTQQGQGHHHHHHGAAAAQNPISSYIANSVLGSSTTAASSTATTASSAGSSVKVSA